jgi:hypothetical protein
VDPHRSDKKGRWKKAKVGWKQVAPQIDIYPIYSATWTKLTWCRKNKIERRIWKKVRQSIKNSWSCTLHSSWYCLINVDVIEREAGRVGVGLTHHFPSIYFAVYSNSTVFPWRPRKLSTIDAAAVFPHQGFRIEETNLSKEGRHVHQVITSCHIRIPICLSFIINYTEFF